MLHASACIVPLRTVCVSTYKAKCTCTTATIICAVHAVSVAVLDGGRFIINSRVLCVEESSLLKGILCMVTSDDDARWLMSVQTASDSGTRYDAVPDDNVGLHLEFGRHHVFFTLEAATALTCQQLRLKVQMTCLCGMRQSSVFLSHLHLDLAVQPLAWIFLLLTLLISTGLLALDSWLVFVTVRVCTSCGPLLEHCG